MAVANIVDNFVKIGSQGETTTGTITFNGITSDPVNYTLNKSNNICVLTIEGCLGIISSTTITANVNFGNIDTVSAPIEVTLSTGTLTYSDIGIIILGATNITILAGTDGTQFTPDTTINQGWNKIIITFTI